MEPPPADAADSSIVGELRALRAGAGLLDLRTHGVTRASGPDRATFLQGMLTNDVGHLPSGQALEALLLNNKGRILAELFVVARDEEILLLTNPETRSALPDTLNRFLVMEEAEVTDVSDELGFLSVQGPAASVALSTGLGIDEVALRGLPRHATLDHDGATLIKHDRFASGDGFDLVASRTRLDELAAHLRGGGALAVSAAAVELQRLESGRPRFGVDMGEEQFPQEAQLEGRTVSWEKGCYIGQETVCRIKFRGKVNQRLHGLRLELPVDVAPPADGTALFVDGETKSIGTITRALRSPLSGQVTALAYVRAAHEAAGTRLHVGAPDAAFAELIALPFLPA